jgi:DNA-directed RNA polymerase specialized sigma24 family protein
VEGESERELCRKYAGRILGYGLRHLQDQTAAEDLVQHVLLIVLRALREGRAGPAERLDGYVLVTCRNSVMDMRRGDSRQRRLAARSAEGLVEGYEPEAWAGVELLNPQGTAVVQLTHVPFDRQSGEILVACQRHYQNHPVPDPVFQVHAVAGGVRREVGRYFVRHTWG